MLNLHGIVRGAITANYPDSKFTLYRSVGQTNRKGIKTALYRIIDSVIGNFQSEGDATLNYANQTAQNTFTRKLYVYCDDNRELWSLYRPLAKTGDYIVDKDGQYWLITSVIEDFHDVGWVSLRCVLVQGDAPTLTIEEA